MIVIDHLPKILLLIVYVLIAFVVEDISYEFKINQMKMSFEKNLYAVRYFSRSLNFGWVDIKSLNRTDPVKVPLVFAVADGGDGGAVVVEFVWWKGRLIKFIFNVDLVVNLKKTKRKMRVGWMTSNLSRAMSRVNTNAHMFEQQSKHVACLLCVGSS